MKKLSVSYFLIKKWVICFSFLILSSSVLQAEWDPINYLDDITESTFDRLEDPAFKDMKERVMVCLSQSWCSSEKINLLMDLIVLTQPKVCVEIGAFAGASVMPVAETLKYLQNGTVFAIDAWSNDEAVKYLANDDSNKIWWSQINMKKTYKAFNRLFKRWDLYSYCTVIHKPSEEAVHEVNNIDFLHIDGNFSEIGSLRDVELYLPKVKSGGYVLLSNLFLMAPNNHQPKLKAFSKLFETCEVVAEIEQNNAVLMRKE